MVARRAVGATGLVVSEIGFGCGGNAGLMIRGEPAEQDRVVAHALACGITHFDTAPDYGDGLAESNLGRALRAARGDVTITTKVEIRAENLGDISGHVERSVEASLRRLGRDGVDCIQIHNGPTAAPTALDGGGYKTLGLADYLRPGGALDGIERVLRAGKARHAGFICRGGDAREVGTLLGTGRVALLNLPYTLLNPSAGRVVAEAPGSAPDYGDAIGLAAAAGAGVAVFSPLAGGLLTPALVAGRAAHPLARPRRSDDPNDAGKTRMARRFADLADRFGIGLVDLAYRFILSDDRVSTVLGGVSSLEQVDGIARAAGNGALPAELLTQIELIWRERAPSSRVP